MLYIMNPIAAHLFVMKKRILIILSLFLLLALVWVITRKISPQYGVVAYGDKAYFFNNSINRPDIITTLSPNYLGQNQSNSIWNYAPQSILISLFKVLSLQGYLKVNRCHVRHPPSLKDFAALVWQG